MKIIRFGKSAILLWSVAFLLVSGVGVGILAYYVWQTATIPFEVKEPLEILSYTSGLSLFPGETEELVITVQNQASINYSVKLDFQLSNTTYQLNYVTFSDETYTVLPGQQTLTGWVSVESDSPPINASLTIKLKRIAKHEFASPTNIKIEAYPTTDVYLRSHGLSIDEPLPDNWWLYPGYEFRVTGRGFIYERTENLEPGEHYIEYATSGYVYAYDLAWHARIYINDVLMAEGDVGRDSHLRAYLNIASP